MEQRLFIIACIMYAFTLITRKLNKRNFLEKKSHFVGWHTIFWFLFVAAASYLFFFISNGGESMPVSSAQCFISGILALAGAGFAFWQGKRATDKQKEKLIKGDLDWSNTIYFAGFVASIVMFFFVQAFKIPSASMRYTLVEGDHLFVNKAAYGFRVPFTHIRFGQFKDIKVGDVVVLKFPAKSREQINCGTESQYGRDFVKRVIAVGGDTVQIKNGRPWVNGKELPKQDYEVYEDIPRIESAIAPGEESLYQQLWQDHLLDNYLGLELRDSFGPVVVPQGMYFVMGDNRDNSCDSRFWGPVPRENIKGQAWFVHWPLNKIHIIK